MAHTRILFVPWPRAMGVSIGVSTAFESNVVNPTNGRERIRFKDPNKVRSDAGLEYEYKNRVWRTSDTAGGKSVHEVWYTGSMSIILLGAPATSAVYIRGHCIAGSPSLFTKKLGGEEHLTAAEVATRLIESGLPTTYAGTIKCYNCHSAEPVGSDDAFAQRLANLLFHSGYTNCTFEGYIGALDSHPANDGHRYTTNGGRASAPGNRVTIQPH